MSTNNEVQAEKKLEECKHFLDMVIKSIEQEKMYYFSAFLASWRSVFDILLLDAAIMFDLGLTREKHFSSYKFTEAAIQQDKYDALKFYKWWKNTWKELQEELLYKERNYLVHRGTYEPPSPEHVEVDENIENYFDYIASVTFRNTIIEYQPFSAHPEIPFVITPVHEYMIDTDCTEAYQIMFEIVEKGKSLIQELRT